MGNSFNNFLRFSATSAFVACAGVVAADEKPALLAVTPEECSEQTIQNLGTVDDYLACVIGQQAADGYFHGRKELPHDVYDELLDVCTGVRGFEEDAEICREIYPQSFHYDPSVDVSVGISFEQAKDCNSFSVESPFGTTNDFLICAIGDEQAALYDRGELKLSPSVHDRVSNHCLHSRDGDSNTIAKDCYKTFPVVKIPTR